MRDQVGRTRRGKYWKRQLEREGPFWGQIETWHKGNSQQSTGITPAKTLTSGGCFA